MALKSPLISLLVLCGPLNRLRKFEIEQMDPSLSQQKASIFCVAVCDGLTLVRCQAPAKAALSLLPRAGQGRGNIMREGSCVEVRTGRDHSSNIPGKTDCN